MTDNAPTITRRTAMLGAALGAAGFAASCAPQANNGVNDGGGYRLVYAAQEGCGQNHDYSNLDRAAQIPGVNLIYVQPFNSTQPYVDTTGRAAPGRHIPIDTTDNAISYLTSLGIRAFNPTLVTLIAPNNEKILETESKSPEFVTQIQEAVARHRAQQREAQTR